jgi:hypothetical protein
MTSTYKYLVNTFNLYMHTQDNYFFLTVYTQLFFFLAFELKNF